MKLKNKALFQMLEEEYVQEAADKEWMQQYEKPNRELDNRCLFYDVRYRART